ncbi:hypothetical protein COCCADRAFT_31285 [Bipolaris zeicola 26-R-13]|uniref:Uncharacterized protein n=1 Tax=Cochliobolus carbonum (strain 26-R-13) TaxID=930089 RepID=W6XWQ5_COCC2|nr:uncharacterized protein COCCADRAFT_31285 [Bipolaris zeicola 26-R-13]EUC27164.1 hypothetical protein COCCADRAFT_31285 [Bipolaris zeicola 26-R-13]
MDEMGNKVAISFDWPLKAVTSTERTRANSSAVALQQGNSSTRRRSQQSATSQSLRPTDSSSQLEELVSLRLSQDIDASVQVSLLETDESIRLHDLASSRNSDDIHTGTGQNTVDCVAQPTRIPQTSGETYNNASLKVIETILMIVIVIVVAEQSSDFDISHGNRGCAGCDFTWRHLISATFVENSAARIAFSTIQYAIAHGALIWALVLLMGRFGTFRPGLLRGGAHRPEDRLIFTVTMNVCKHDYDHSAQYTMNVACLLVYS